MSLPDDNTRSNDPDEHVSKKARMPIFVEFDRGDWKKGLTLLDDNDCVEFDRNQSIEDFRDGLVYLAKECRRENLNNKDMPVLCLWGPSAASKTKTELLKWIFHNCCTFIKEEEEAPANQSMALSIRKQINDASPPADGTFIKKPLENLVVLLASFNQPFSETKGLSIYETVAERLCLSYEGDFGLQENRPQQQQKHYSNIEHVGDITAQFPANTGFIFCIDAICNLMKSNNKREYENLMDHLLCDQQNMLAEGQFCALVVTSHSVYDFETLGGLKDDDEPWGMGRSEWPIRYVGHKPLWPVRIISSTSTNK